MQDHKRLLGQNASDPPQIMAGGREAEVRRLTAEIKELREELVQVTRRANRLMGERNQLNSLLERRDGQIQQLNREIGSHQRYLPPGQEGDLVSIRARLGSLVAERLAGLRARFARAPSQANLQTGFAANGSVNGGGNGNGASGGNGSVAAHLVPRYRTEPQRPILAILVFGLSADEIEKILPQVERLCQAKQMLPLILTDNDAFAPLRARRLIFEFLPPAEARERFDPDLRWDLYFQRRLALIRRKWQPVRIVAFGQSAAKIMTLWQESPFEETVLPAVAGGQASRAVIA